MGPSATWCRAVAAFLAILVPALASGHALEQSYVFLRVDDDAVHGRFEITVGDLNRELGLDFPTDLTATDTDVDRHIGAIERYVLERVNIAADGAPTTLRIVDHGLWSISLAQYVTLDFVLDGIDRRPGTLDVTYEIGFGTGAHHEAYLVVEHDWRTGTFNNEASISLSFTANARTQRLELASPSVLRGFAGFVRRGFRHATAGIDHVLFLIVLLLPSALRRVDRGWLAAEGLRPALGRFVLIVALVAIVEAITVAVVTSAGLLLPPDRIDGVALIAVMVIGLTIVLPLPRSIAVGGAMLFAVLHGLGYATVIDYMAVSSAFMPLTILGFGLGSTAGHVLVAVVAVPLLFALGSAQAYVRYAMPAVSIAVIGLSLYWFAERAVGVDLPAGAIARRIIGLFS